MLTGGYDEGPADGAGQLPSILIATARKPLTQRLLPRIEEDHKVTLAGSGWEAATYTETCDYDLVLVDADLPQLSGFDLIKRMARGRAVYTPVLLLHTIEDTARAEELTATRQISARQQLPCAELNILHWIWHFSDKRREKDWDHLSPLQSRVLKVTQRDLQKLFAGASKTRELDRSLIRDCSDAIVQAAKAGELTEVLDVLREHHSYTFVHSLKVASLLTIFGVHTGFAENDLHVMAQGGLLHDVGKSLTPVDLLDKPTRLSEQEWRVMRRHVDLSMEMLGNAEDVPEEIVKIAGQHHEKMDGSGYPHGLKGAQIDDLGLITAISDVYSALVDKRAYKESMDPEDAIGVMEGMKGPHLEPGFLDCFIGMIREGKAGSLH